MKRQSGLSKNIIKQLRLKRRISKRLTKGRQAHALGTAHKKNKFAALLKAFIVQVKKGSPRAIGVLSGAAVIFVVLPLTLLLVIKPKEKPELKEQKLPIVSNANDDLMIMANDSSTFSAGLSQYSDTDTQQKAKDPHPLDGDDLKRGVTAPVVKEIQERLMELGYLDWDEPTEFYGPNTYNAVRLFQRQHGLTIDGSVGKLTYEALLSPNAQAYTITVGVEDDDVKELQTRLYELGYLETKPTRYFGTETEAAVKKFQERNGLSPDGAVGEKTRELLYSEDVKANYYERGEVSEKLRTYQERLKKLGYLTTDADGTYGKDTENAVKRFQERSGLIADGYLGPQTITLLLSDNAQANALMMGMRGPDVQKIQTRLKELGYMTGKITDYYGTSTETAVRNFQRVNKLTVDGKVGKNTMNAILSSKAKKYDGGTTAPSSDSSGSSGSSGSSSSGSSGSSGSSSSSGANYASNIEGFIAAAQSKLGCKYSRGAKGPNSFDCSGFVYWALNQAGVKQGYMTSAGWQKTDKYQRISGMNNLQRGDVVSFKGHVGIYLGDGKMIDASSSEGKIRICSNIQGSSYWQKTFVCGYRIF